MFWDSIQKARSNLRNLDVAWLDLANAVHKRAKRGMIVKDLRNEEKKRGSRKKFIKANKANGPIGKMPFKETQLE